MVEALSNCVAVNDVDLSLIDQLPDTGANAVRRTVAEPQVRARPGNEIDDEETLPREFEEFLFLLLRANMGSDDRACQRKTNTDDG
jgi:hypothetical protein